MIQLGSLSKVSERIMHLDINFKIPTCMHTLDLAVTITENTSGTAGLEFTVTCSVTAVEYLIVQLTFQWSGGSVGSSGVTESDTTLSGSVSARTLTFNPLRTSHGGEYTCQVKASISSISVTWTGSEGRAVIVQSKCPKLMLIAIIHLL